MFFICSIIFSICWTHISNKWVVITHHESCTASPAADLPAHRRRQAGSPGDWPGCPPARWRRCWRGWARGFGGHRRPSPGGWDLSWMAASWGCWWRRLFHLLKRMVYFIFWLAKMEKLNSLLHNYYVPN